MANIQGRIDAAEIARAFRLLVGDGNVSELRALHATTAGDRYPRTLYGYFDDADKLAADVMTITSAKGVYIIPNQVNPDLLARAANRLKQAGKGDDTPQRPWRMAKLLHVPEPVQIVRPELLQARAAEAPGRRALPGVPGKVFTPVATAVRD